MQRQQEIHDWIQALHPGRPFTLAPASADASFRRYFRVTFADGASAIVMDAPPSHEDVRPWLHVQQLFSAAGAHVPAVEAQDLERGYLLLSDLGNTTYLSLLSADDPATARRLYLDAIDALIRIQKASVADALPAYDRPLLKREIDLFPEWYVQRHLGVTLDAPLQKAMEQAFERIIDVNLAEPRVFVHRDYHSRNLMCLPEGHNNPGVIDFQDAVYGPISYDMVSLLKDAYIEWTEEMLLDWLITYWERARKAGLPISADFAEFHRDFEWMGVQRHLKVLGIFARLYHRDGKDGYLKDMPLVAKYLRAACTRYAELSPIRKVLDLLEDKVTVLGYTMSRET